MMAIPGRVVILSENVTGSCPKETGNPLATQHRAIHFYERPLLGRDTGLWCTGSAGDECAAEGQAENRRIVLVRE